MNPSINSYKRQTQQIQARDKRGRYTRTLTTAEDDDDDLNRSGSFTTQQPVTKAATPHTSTLSTTILQALPIKPLDAHTINQLYEESRSFSKSQILTLRDKQYPQIFWFWTQVLQFRREPGARSSDFVPYKDIPHEETTRQIPGVLKNAHIQRDKDIESDIDKLQRLGRYPLRSTTEHL